MDEYKFIKCVRNNKNEIEAYILIDEYKRTIKLTPVQLISNIKERRMKVINLKIKEDGTIAKKRIKRKKLGKDPNKMYISRELVMEVNSEKSLAFKSNNKVSLDSLKSKSILLGKTVRKIQNDVYALENDSSIILISSKQFALPKESCKLFFNTSFTKISFDNVDSSEADSMSEMFNSCAAEELDITNLDTSNVMFMDDMFRDSHVRKLDLSNFNTSKVVSMSSMFYNIKIKELDLSNFDTSNVTAMGYMFADAEIDKLDISNFNTSNVRSMYNMFSNSEIHDLNLSSFDTSNVKDMSEMFMWSRVKELDISSFDTSKVENMKFMFSNCNIDKLDLSNFNTSNVKYMYSMFSSSNIKELNISSFDTSNVKDMKAMFANFKTNGILDLSSFKCNETLKTETNAMFKDCLAKEIIIKDSTLKVELNKTLGV